eukprot:TRINITY_DN2883_c0_g1_i3.p1 TRINITY_DN2883_c0_g1~~TRINITY_DN2883_c0_g1_i3.p1  ORF type:complete len:354 (-),score=24.94 TRINITY_DN2883_c0_g1_i3:142-1203(-)
MLRLNAAAAVLMLMMVAASIPLSITTVFPQSHHIEREHDATTRETTRPSLAHVHTHRGDSCKGGSNATSQSLDVLRQYSRSPVTTTRSIATPIPARPLLLGVGSLRKRELRFVHIPKTGGETIESIFNLKKHHYPASDPKRVVGNEDADLDPTHFSFTIVRNPYERVVSWFRFCGRGYHGNSGNEPTPINLCEFARKHASDFPTFVRETLTPGLGLMADRHQWKGKTGGRLMDSLAETIHGKFYLMTQYEWITTPCDSAPVVLDEHGFVSNFDKREVAVDYVMRFEHYQDHLTQLAALLGRSCSVTKAVHENSSSDGHKFEWWTLYDETSREIVESHFAIDFTMFSYTFRDRE